MPLYESLVELDGVAQDIVDELVEDLPSLVGRRHEVQAQRLEDLSEYIPVLLIFAVGQSLGIWTVQMRQAQGVLFKALAGPVNALGPIVFVPHPHARNTIQQGRVNFRAFMEGAYVWRKS